MRMRKVGLKPAYCTKADINMANHEHYQKLAFKLISIRKIQFVLSGFAAPHVYIIGASRSIASYTVNSGSFVQYAG